MSPPPRDRPDTLFDGTLTLHQPARGEGYRVNVDAVLLAWFAGAPKRAKRAVDLGSGVGAVGLCLLYRDRVEHVMLADVDHRLAGQALQNLVANGWGDRGGGFVIDVRVPDALGLAAYDLVVCNPPYIEKGRGRAPTVANGARVGELSLFTTAARKLLAPRGRACFVYPAIELATLLATLRASGLEPKRLCMVHATASKPARVALVEAVPGKRGGLVVAAPFIEREAGAPSARLRGIMSRQ